MGKTEGTNTLKPGATPMSEYDVFEVYSDGEWVEVDRGEVDDQDLVYTLDKEYGVASPGEWRYQISGHALKIISLRDLQAECSCGRWSLSSPTFDHDSDEYLTDHVNAEHALHVNRNA